ncbi:MAG: chemotaxis response regulator protein-glutamate methylesterase [Desulfuromonadales bacterium]|nr:chemotaxis response regulator protein-glutamate methylesterase [Desulfuromonadales bacterium]
MNKRIRVVVVDDSAFSRRSITKMLDGFAGIQVVGYAVNGEEGIRKVIALKPDLVTLDLEMPKMDGFTLLRILATRFSTPVVVVSAQGGADNVFKALELGAFDFIVKPSNVASEQLLFIQNDLRNKVLQAMDRKPGIKTRAERTDDRNVTRYTCAKPESHPSNGSVHPFDIVAIGASTGGPPALQSIFSSFERQLPFAVVVSQHMPAGFTRAFAERLNRSSAFAVKEAEEGDAVLPGRILIAPGGMNLVLETQSGKVIVRIVSPTPADRYTPSVDVMFTSCAEVYGKRMMAVVLTGMGNDGSRGLRSVKERGGFIVAESDETAVVYGMPREAVATGCVDQVLPLQHVAHEILFRGAFL